ncbi:hypothetical protein F8B43_5100 [Methylorubrum populi]|uniref:Uncharacterized protein n=1 Tax=Methylorubrum populi TaxID=223967 RepID=A0A833J0B2_9HYPH|nr:hypothetical protein F8B43_5100 [Methylorubrum populi]
MCHCPSHAAALRHTHKLSRKPAKRPSHRSSLFRRAAPPCGFDTARAIGSRPHFELILRVVAPRRQSILNAIFRLKRVGRRVRRARWNARAGSRLSAKAWPSGMLPFRP